jgi:hypothetical protein
MLQWIVWIVDKIYNINPQFKYEKVTIFSIKKTVERGSKRFHCYTKMEGNEKEEKRNIIQEEKPS